MKNLAEKIRILFMGMLIAVFSITSAFAEELRMMTWEGYAPEKHVGIFRQLVREKYGVELNLSIKYISNPDEFYKGVRNKRVDIFSPTHNIPKDPKYKFIKGKLALPIDLNHIPHYKEMIPSFQKADYFTEGGQVYVVPFLYGPYGLAYNTGILKETPMTWNILWDPKYARKYAISSDYYEVNIFTTALAMGVDKDKIHHYDAVYSHDMVDKLKHLVKNAGKLWTGVDTADDLQGLSLAAAWGFSFAELKKRGEVWKMSDPEEGSAGWIDCWMISHTLRNKPKLKRIAEEWINYAISPEFQLNVAVRELSSGPVNLTIKDQLTPEEREAFHLNNPNYFQNKFLPWKILDRRTRRGFKLLWKKATR